MRILDHFKFDSTYRNAKKMGGDSVEGVLPSWGYSRLIWHHCPRIWCGHLYTYCSSEILSAEQFCSQALGGISDCAEVIAITLAMPLPARMNPEIFPRLAGAISFQSGGIGAGLNTL
jgi:hypothetical protein